MNPEVGIKAMVMAAGAGTRLRPLTQNYPKPMVPVLNKPVIEHTLENLRRHGIVDVAMNLHHQPDFIRKYCGDGSQWDLKLRYSYEPKLFGTAGGVKKLEGFLKGGTFVVMSGDGLCDINLSDAIQYHRKNKALATIVVKKVDARFEYGVVISRGGRIVRFVEKPSWSSAFANSVNTGIYILEPKILSYIPKNKFYDFGNELWPRLLESRMRLCAYELNSYWCDVGNLKEYRQAQWDALERKICLNVPGRQVKPGVWIGEGAKIAADVKLIGPCVIGNNCRIRSNAVIGELTVIGSNADIGSGVVITNSILWDKVKVHNNVHLNNCIIGFNARVRESISVFEGAVINCVVSHK